MAGRPRSSFFSLTLPNPAGPSFFDTFLYPNGPLEGNDGWQDMSGFGYENWNVVGNSIVASFTGSFYEAFNNSVATYPASSPWTITVNFTLAAGGDLEIMTGADNADDWGLILGAGSGVLLISDLGSNTDSDATDPVGTHTVVITSDGVNITAQMDGGPLLSVPVPSPWILDFSFIRLQSGALGPGQDATVHDISFTAP